MSDQAPKIIGYWFHSFSEDAARYPHPQDLVRKDWLDVRTQSALLSYLRAAPEFEAYRGLSWCRFECGVDNRVMGYREFWDGEWVWPEGLAHYVEHHGVYLPDEFVSRAVSGLPPSSLPSPAFPRHLDFGFWLDWASKQSRQRHD